MLNSCVISRGCKNVQIKFDLYLHSPIVIDRGTISNTKGSAMRKSTITSFHTAVKTLAIVEAQLLQELNNCDPSNRKEASDRYCEVSEALDYLKELRRAYMQECSPLLSIRKELYHVVFNLSPVCFYSAKVVSNVRRELKDEDHINKRIKKYVHSLVVTINL